MHRPEVRLHAWSFTSSSALAREILALLEGTDFKITIEVTPPQYQELCAELESCKTLGRVKVEMIGQ